MGAAVLDGMLTGMRIVRIQHEGAARWGQLDDQTVHLLTGLGGQTTGETVPLDATALLAPA